MARQRTGSREGLLAGLLRRADRVLALAAGLLIAGIGLLTCIDVFGRYAIGRPLQGAFEVSELAMGALIFTSLPLVTMRGQHVTIDLLDGLLPARARRLQAVVIDLLSALCTAVLAWRLWARAGEMSSSGETTAILQLAVYPLVYYMALLSALAALFGVLLAGRHVVAGADVETGARG